jgi:uncharacterized PurR-regulated membrane protein YhhQ (DUF165 family)
MARALVNKSGLIAGMVAMGLIVWVSNIAVQYPINDWLTWGAFTYPIAFLVTDLTNRIFGVRTARGVVYAGFVVGLALSWFFADERIAIASGTAFLAAQLLDIAIFDRLRRGAWWKAPLVSSLIASAVDTALFFGIAFIGTGLPWVTWAIGDYAAKLAMAAILLVPFGLLVSMLPERLRRAEGGPAF